MSEAADAQAAMDPENTLYMDLKDGRVVEHGPRTVLAADPTSRYARMRAAGTLTEELA